MTSIGFLAGALIPTGVLALLFIWMPGRYIAAPVPRALLANALALAVATVIGAYGAADGGPPRFGEAFVTYLLPQAIWLAVWIWRAWRPARA
jgi:hypothetical protein